VSISRKVLQALAMDGVDLEKMVEMSDILTSGQNIGGTDLNSIVRIGVFPNSKVDIASEANIKEPMRFSPGRARCLADLVRQTSEARMVVGQGGRRRGRRRTRPLVGYRRRSRGRVRLGDSRTCSQGAGSLGRRRVRRVTPVHRHRLQVTNGRHHLHTRVNTS
jgi:hypothetical protein